MQIESASVTAMATVLAAVTGALLGACGTYLAQRRFYYKEQLHQRNSVRLALIAELKQFESMNELHKDPSYAILFPNILGGVYDSIRSDIKLLSRNEIQSVVSFYGYFHVSQTILREELKGERFTTMTDEKLEDLAASVDLQDISSLLEDQKTKAVRSLEENVEKELTWQRWLNTMFEPIPDQKSGTTQYQAYNGLNEPWITMGP